MKVHQSDIFSESEKPFHSSLLNIKRLSPHYHEDSIEIVFCLKGEINIVAGMQKVHLCEGEIFSIDCEDIHYLYSDMENEVLITDLNINAFQYSPYLLKNMLFACESQHCFPYQQGAMSDVKDLLLTFALSEFNGGQPSIDSDAACRIMYILYRYFNYYTYDNPDDYMNPEMFQRFNRMILYCLENYKYKITTSQVAEHTHISKNYLAQYLRNTPFGNFSSMLKDIRCYKAERLLLTTTMSNNEISFACGFSDPKYFYSAFDEWCQCSPHTHRLNYRKYMRQEENYFEFSADASVDIIKDQIIRWHVEKTT